MNVKVFKMQPNAKVAAERKQKLKDSGKMNVMRCETKVQFVRTVLNCKYTKCLLTSSYSMCNAFEVGSESCHLSSTF